MLGKLSKYAWLNLHKVLLIGTVVLYFFLLILPFIAFGQHPLGYDTGFYRRYLTNPNISIPNLPVPGLDHTVFAPRIFLDFIHTLGFSPDVGLYGSYILLCLIFVVVFYFFVREYTDKSIALIALGLLVLSPIQYTGYWFMLYKNFFGLIFFFLTFIFLKKKWFLPASLCALIVPLSHQTSTIMLLGVLGGYVLLTLLFKKRFLIPELIILTLTLFTYLSLHPHVQQKIAAPPVGIFIEKWDFLLMTIPIILLTLIGFPKFLRILKHNYVLIAWGVLGIISPLFFLPYYQRVFLFTNYWLVLGAAVGIQSLLTSHIFDKNDHYKLVAVAIVGLMIIHGGFLVEQVLRLEPLIPQGVVQEISNLPKTIPDNASVLTSVRLAPWVQGWATAKVYAPGILKDQHPLWEWQSYWGGSDGEKIAFLSAFPQPLYIFIDNSQRDLFIPKISCVQKITQMLYVYDCRDKLSDL